MEDFNRAKIIPTDIEALKKKNNDLLYLIAHAPQTIPDWFKPEIRARPTPKLHPREVYADVQRYYDDEADEWFDKGAVADAFKIKIKEDIERYVAFREDNEKWYYEYDAQRSVQWPIFWAKEVLKRYQDGH